MPVMRLLAVLLLLAGWGLVLASIGMLKSDLPRAGFVLAGVAVELLGLALLAKSYLLAREERA
jgi:hypothetical protein